MNPKFIVIDLFCGAGGTTTGFAQAEQNGDNLAVIAACINHDAKAIESHWKNHPEVEHYNEDITTLYGVVWHNVLFQSDQMMRLKRLVDIYCAFYADAKVILWASLECTNFSKAKGGQARDADSRTLADHIDRYVSALNPDYIQIENVVEFMAWGPLDNKGKPVSKRSGADWLKWCEHINTFGYRNEWKELNSADFGAYTSRNRLFGCFAKEGLPIVFPTPTHSKKPGLNMFGELKKWKAVKEVLDFKDEGESIFNRKKPLVDASLERIYAGLTKHVIQGQENFIMKYNSMNSKGKHTPPSVNEPCPTVACQSRLGVVKANFIASYYSGNPNSKVKSVSQPLGTITTIDHNALVSVSTFLVKYHGGEKGCHSIENPASTLTTKDRLAKVEVKSWLDKQYSGPENHSSIEVPAGTILTTDKHQLATAYILNPSHGGNTHSVAVPCPTIVARQDKAPLYVVTCDLAEDSFCIPIYEDDSSVMVKIKKFMAQHGIVDIKMRMLKVDELILIQGFPKDYVLVGNQADRKKFIGNSVVPLVVKLWCEAMATTDKLKLKSINLEAA